LTADVGLNALQDDLLIAFFALVLYIAVCSNIVSQNVSRCFIHVHNQSHILHLFRRGADGGALYGMLKCDSGRIIINVIYFVQVAACRSKIGCLLVPGNKRPVNDGLLLSQVIAGSGPEWG